MSAHKIYGPKGVGALFIKKGTPFDSQMLGGGQELGMRSGTENVAGIVGLGAAAQEIQSPKTEIRNIKIRQLRDKIIQWTTKNIEGATLTGSTSQRLENNVHIMFEGLDGKDILLLLDQKGVAASAGSACSENAQEPSRVLKALGFSDKEANSGVRITLGKYTTAKEVETVLKCLASVVSQLRNNTV
jgi:cysteine desulfurase